MEDQNLGSTQVDRRLSKVTKDGQCVDLSLQNLKSRGQQDQVVKE